MRVWSLLVSWLRGQPATQTTSNTTGRNGKPADNAMRHILSPYDADRSAVTNCYKLAWAAFEEQELAWAAKEEEEQEEIIPESAKRF